MNSRSIAGVSHSTESHSDRLFTEADAPLIRTCRRSGAAASVPVPMLDLAEAWPQPPSRRCHPAAPYREAPRREARGRGEHRDRLEHIGLARAVLAEQQHEARPRLRSMAVEHRSGSRSGSGG